MSSQQPTRPSRTIGSRLQPIAAQTIGDALTWTASRQPDAEALISTHQGIRWNYRVFASEVESVALALLGLGIVKADRIAICADNCAEWSVMQFACARVGAILVSVNPGYDSAQLRHVLASTGARLLFTDAADRHRHELPCLERVVGVGNVAELARAREGVSRLALGDREATLLPDDPIAILYTRGTTDRPKAVTLTHRSLLGNARAVMAELGIAAHDRVCVPMSLASLLGMGIGTLGSVSSGATVVYPAPALDAFATLKAIQRERCTSVYGDPRMWSGLLDHPGFREFDLRSLRTGLVTGATCPEETLRWVGSKMHVRDLRVAYGATEAGPISFMTRPNDPATRLLSSVGVVMPQLEAKIISVLTDQTLPVGIPGEICVRGYALMQGYWGDPTGTESTIDVEGWLHTGDLGMLDDDDNLHLTGRIAT
jgi:fatty-acyl-CoA synthase